MNSSTHQRVMRRISPTARRCLFPVSPLEQEASLDNLSNVLQESIARDHDVMKEKYNFDFETETPLPGTWDWFARDEENWVGVNANPNIKTEVKPDEDCNAIKQENESTPKERPDRELPAVRKRKSDAAASDSGAKRALNFDEN